MTDPAAGAAAVPDRIELRGLRLVGTHGVLAEEQARAQPFEVDLDVETDLGAAGDSDDLELTLDYAELVAIAERVVAAERHHLLERIAARIAEEILADARVHAVEVTVRKLRPPVPADLATAGVRIRRERLPLRRVFLGLGANLGDTRATLRAAVDGLPDVVAVSSLYETDPVGGPAGQPPYANLVVELRTALAPRAVLAAAQDAEAAAGRSRGPGDARWGARTLDVDVLWIDGEAVAEPGLVVPHPRMFERLFVLAPLAELAPDLVVPGDLDRLAASQRARRVGPL